MNTLLKACVIGVSMVSTAAMAELSDFTGFEAGATLSANTGKIENGNFSSNGNNATLGLHGGYGLEISKDSVLLFGLDYNTGNVSVGSAKYNSGVSKEINFEKPYGLSVGYGLLVKDDTLAFAKLSYEATKYSEDNNSINLTGFGLGAGARYLINKTTYLQGELKYTKYTNSKDYDIGGVMLTNVQVNVGVGMRF